MSSSLSCLLALSGSSLDLALGVVGCSVCGVGIGWCVLRVIRVDTVCKATSRRRGGGHRSSNIAAIAVRWMFLPLYEWRNRNESSSSSFFQASRERERFYVQQFGVLFEGYQRGRHWFVGVELATSAACGVISGLQTALGTDSASCWWLVASLTAVNVAALVCTVVLRPYQRGWELVMFGLSNLLGLAWGAASLAGSSTIADELAAMQVWLLLVQVSGAAVDVLARRFVRVLQFSSLPAFTVSTATAPMPAKGATLEDESKRRSSSHRARRRLTTDSELMCTRLSDDQTTRTLIMGLQQTNEACEVLIRLICSDRST